MRIRIFMLALIALSCSGVSDNELQLQPTQLHVRVLGDDNQTVPNAKVYLYRDYLSFSTKTGEAAKAVTNERGIAEFTNLDPYNYFIYATHNKNGNVHDNTSAFYTLDDFLTENAITNVTLKTAYYCPAVPTEIEIDKIDLIPITKNSDWKGVKDDNIYGEYLLIKNYSGGQNLYEEDIVAWSQVGFKLFGKTPMGERIDNDSYKDEKIYDFFSDLPRLNINEIKNGPAEYSLVFVWFTNSDDFDNRYDIFSGDATAEDDYDFEEKKLSEKLAAPFSQSNPFPKRVYFGSTHSTENNYLIYVNLHWQ